MIMETVNRSTETSTVSQKPFIPDCDYLFNEQVQSKGKKKTPFLRNIFKKNFLSLVVSSLLFIFQNLPVWVTPLITANIINMATVQIATKTPPTPEFWQSIFINAIILVIIIVQNVPSTILRRRITDTMVRRISGGIKCSVVRKLQSLAITYHKDILTGKIQSKFLKDTEKIEMFLRHIISTLIPNIISIIIAVGISVVKNGWVSLFFLLIVPCNVSLGLFFRNKVKRQAKEFRLRNEQMSNKLTTMLGMVQVTKSHGLEEVEILSARETIANTTESGVSFDRTNAKFGSTVFVVTHTLNTVCLIFCIILAVNGSIGVGDIVLYQSLFSQISGYVTNLVNLLPEFSTGADAVNSVSEIMNATEIETNTGKIIVPKITGNLRFENVTYRYPNTEVDVVKDFSLDVKQGECIAVVGSSGSGKTTLMNLIIGFMQPVSGKFYVDDKSIDEINLSEYRHNLSVVPQASILFAGTIRENITYGLTHYSEEDLKRVCEIANVNEFLKDLPDGLDTYIGERGDKLSGGQKQRVTIARALIRNPKILILDEATSALDNISEYHVQKAIESSIKGRTTFIVAHRLSTIRGADRIVVMENGRIVEMGNYEELMAKKGKFFELKALNDMNLQKVQEQLA